MAFGRKKKAEVEKPKVDMEVSAAAIKTLPVVKPAVEKAVVEKAVVEPTPVEVPEIAPAPTPVEEPAPVEVPEMAPSAQVISGEVLDNGLFRFVVVANKSIGEIGEILPLD